MIAAIAAVFSASGLLDEETANVVVEQGTNILDIGWEGIVAIVASVVVIGDRFGTDN